MKYQNNHIEVINKNIFLVISILSQQCSGTSCQWKNVRKRNEAYILGEKVELLTKNYTTSLEQNQDNYLIY